VLHTLQGLPGLLFFFIVGGILAKLWLEILLSGLVGGSLMEPTMAIPWKLFFWSVVWQHSQHHQQLVWDGLLFF
jgi:hypothetical protein